MARGKDPLIGKYFHEIKENGDIGWQGLIEGVVGEEPRRYLVATFSWIDGSNCEKSIVALSDMLRWVFYDSSDEMKYGYGTYARKKGVQYDAAADIEFGKMLRGIDKIKK